MLKRIALSSIRFYQKTDFFHGYFFRLFYMSDMVCRFTPTCSEYTYQAIKKYGVVKGVWIGMTRITRCHPFSKGGRDPLK
jgi:putative membrane protein insertion efficiency factor